MSNKLATSATENLRLGIEAARAGRFEAARSHLSQVLEYAPNNIPALMWMAYVAPEPEESIRWLAQVLVIDPDNERAKAGIEWANRRAEAEQTSGNIEDNGHVSSVVAVQASDEEAELPDAFIRDQFFKADEAQQRARKAALAQRARRNIAPLTLIFLIIGVTTFFSWATWYLITVPDETLAAWWPETLPASMIEPAPVEAKTLVEPELQPEIEAEAMTEVKLSPQNFTSTTDTIIFENSKLAEELEVADPFTPLEENLLPALDIEPVPFEAEQVRSVDLLQLIGPAEEILDGVRLFVPVDEELLAYQPASPDEKWIEVDISKQRVTAWEGNVPVMSFDTSTGLPDTPTVIGQYNIYWKLESTVMIGEDYYLPEVPYTMYFYAGYGLHGAYWHDNFGQPMSHGCVNLSIDNSKQIFEWADPVIPPGQTQVVASEDNPGTLVVVHE